MEIRDKKIIDSLIENILLKVDRKLFLLSNVEKVKYCYEKILENSQYIIKDKIFFLYRWFCVISKIAKDNITEKNYICINNINKNLEIEPLSQYCVFIGNDRLNGISYMNFTQMSVLEEKSDFIYDIEYIFNANILLFHNNIISLRSVMDKINIGYLNIKYAILDVKFSYLIKHNPEIFSSKYDKPKVKSPETNNLCIYADNFNVDICNLTSNIIVDDEKIFPKILEYISNITESMDQYNAIINHIFVLPGRNNFYYQLFEHYSKIGGDIIIANECSKIILPETFFGYNITIENRLLQGSETYNFNNVDLYKTKGETILEIKIQSDKDKKTFIPIINNILSIIKYSDEDDLSYIDNINISNISKLRASNSKIFNAEYSRYCPPLVQPRVINPRDINKLLSAGYIILIYKYLHEGKLKIRYYTTFYSTYDEGPNIYCYIGFKQRFEKYNPEKEYIPIIRTHMKNPLLTNGYKEIKKYLLRNTETGTRGYISKEDILLPKNLEFLYNYEINNLDINPSQIYTKKSKHVNNINISKGDVPSIICEILQSNSCFRKITQGEGTKLLNILNIEKNKFIKFIKLYYNILDDISGLSWKDIKNDINNNNVDHRIYGKLLELYTGISLLVFTKDSISPYRKSRILEFKRTKNIILLFLDDNKKYDEIIYKDINEDKIVSIINSINNFYSRNSKSIDKLDNKIRGCDYIYVFIKITSYIYNILEKLIDVEKFLSFINISEEDIIKGVESMYNKVLPYDCLINRDKEYESYTQSNIDTENKYPIKYGRAYCKIDYNLENMLHLFKEFLTYEKGRFFMKSNIDYFQYQTFRVSIEDIFYSDLKGYKYNFKDELYIIPKQKEDNKFTLHT